MTSMEAQRMIIRWAIWVCIGFTIASAIGEAVDHFTPRTSGLVCACPCDALEVSDE